MADVKTASALPPQPTAPGGPRKRRLWRPMIIMIVVVLVIVNSLIGGAPVGPAHQDSAGAGAVHHRAMVVVPVGPFTRRER